MRLFLQFFSAKKKETSNIVASKRLILRRWIYLTCLATFLFLSPIAWRSLDPILKQREPDVFSLDKIARNLKGDFPTFEMPDLSTIIQGPFQYLGAGGQAVAFESADHQYVLKFFLTKPLHGKRKYPIPKPTHLIPSHRKKRAMERKQRKAKDLFETLRNYAVAFPKMQEQTGIIALQLVSGTSHLPTVILYDASGQKHLVDLNETAFILQKKAVTLTNKFKEKIPDQEAIRLLRSFHRFLGERAQTGLIEVDRNLVLGENYGFIGDTPVQFDVGKLIVSETASPKQEAERMQQVLREWAAAKGLPSYDES